MATFQVKVDAATIVAEVQGDGPTVILIPSLARGSADFADLMAALAAAGYRGVGINLRGVAGSSGALEGISLHDLAGDVAKVLLSLDAAPAHVIGHAYGNCVARCFAADHPDLTRTVTLLAAGGLVPPIPEEIAAFERTLAVELADEEWLACMKKSRFFAGGTDPMVWRNGWWPAVAKSQFAAAYGTPLAEWWTAGSAPLLVIQGVEDGLAPPENGRVLARELGSRVKLVDIPGAAHALLPEQPRLIATAILNFIR